MLEHNPHFGAIPRQQAPQADKFHRPSFSSEARAYFDAIGRDYPLWRKKMNYFLLHTQEFLCKVIPENKKVMLIGCLSSEILEALKPSVGVGVDISWELIETAKRFSRNDRISYFCSLPEDLALKEKFDYIILLNIVDYSQDVLVLIDSLRKFSHEETRICISMLNPLWHSVTRLASRLRIRIPDFDRNLVASRNLATALEIKQFKVIGTHRRILLPKWFPLFSRFFNQFISRLPGLNNLCFLQYVLAKPNFTKRREELSCSVIIPCYNEEGNIAECIRRVPRMGRFTEIVVVNDGSRDRTAAIVEQLLRIHANLKLISYDRNRGKGYAVREGMRKASGDVLLILDADMTVPPEELNEFFEAIDSGAADFASGTRFLYPMEKRAMRLANYIGNILFSKLVEIIVGAECSDTLCGTKVMRKTDFTDFKLEDAAWGDFDLIFHAARRKLKCIQIPVHYRSRIHGESKMRALSSGLSFLHLCFRKWGQLP